MTLKRFCLYLVFSLVSFSLGACHNNQSISFSSNPETCTCVSIPESNTTDSDDGNLFSHYDFLKELEWEATVKRFLPYTYGTPSTAKSADDAYKRCNLLLFSDNHIDFVNSEASLQNVTDTISFANKAPFEISAILNAGDAITQVGNKDEIKNDFLTFAQNLETSRYPVAYSKGNHDLNDIGNIPSNVFDENDWGEMIYNYAEKNWGMVRQMRANGKKSTYGYIDILDFKIRIVIADSQDTDKVSADSNGYTKYHGSNSWYIANEQLNWLANTALNFDDKVEKDWGVIILIHQDGNYSTSLEPEYESSINKLLKICKAFNNCGKYSNNYVFSENSFFNINVSADYTKYANLDKKPHMICWFIGHRHQDKNEVVDGINLIWILNGSATNEYGDARVLREVGTTTQNAFDLVSIDTRERKIRCVRYGAGVNCYGVGGDRFLPDGLSY